ILTLTQASRECFRKLLGQYCPYTTLYLFNCTKACNTLDTRLGIGEQSVCLGYPLVKLRPCSFDAVWSASSCTPRFTSFHGYVDHDRKVWPQACGREVTNLANPIQI